MWPFKKKQEGDNLEGDYRKDPLWYVKKLYKENSQVSGSWCVICDDSFEGVINNIELLSFMEKEGWMFVDMWVVFAPHGHMAEYLFRKC